YPAMIEAIDRAERSVALSTYIFDNDRAGTLFLDGLVRAVARGVEVRVLIDDMGARYSMPSVTHKLHGAGITAARFLPTLLPWRMPFVNLRNHRKILVTDGKAGFTGGMNIREGLLLREGPRNPLQDMHFLIEGPVVDHLQKAFAEDWAFCTGELLQDETWFPPLEPKGAVTARGIPDGPDEDFGKLLWTVQGAIACAKSSIRIVTPYFLPDSALIKALNVASMRGVEVDIILPGVNNLPVVRWACTDIQRQVLEHGCNIWLSPPPFDHSKLLIVDSFWVLFGSGNWDPRSFQLNFEFNVECYDQNLAAQLDEIINSKLKHAHLVSIEEIDSRRLPVKLRDGIARLFSPYL
ncbi:MAG TPA: cardiolipin synthase, partial [Nitrospirae bacterium]|nr:cardiolipin synthase [Nitrospirota bacterium]